MMLTGFQGFNSELTCAKNAEISFMQLNGSAELNENQNI